MNWNLRTLPSMNVIDPAVTLYVRYFIFFIKSSKGKAKMSGETKDYGISSQ